MLKLDSETESEEGVNVSSDNFDLAIVIPHSTAFPSIVSTPVSRSGREMKVTDGTETPTILSKSSVSNSTSVPVRPLLTSVSFSDNTDNAGDMGKSLLSAALMAKHESVLQVIITVNIRRTVSFIIFLIIALLFLI